MVDIASEPITRPNVVRVPLLDGSRPDSFAEAEREAVARMAGRRRALQSSGLNASAHRLLEAGRRFRYLVALFEHTYGNREEAVQAILDAAGESDPLCCGAWGNDAFTTLFSKLSTLQDELAEFVNEVAADMPPPPTEGGADHA